MLPSKEEKLMNNTSFRQLVLSAITRAMKIKADDLTIGTGLTSAADSILLEWIRNKTKNGSLQDHNRNDLVANTTYVAAVLSMFDDSETDDIDADADEQASLVINWDNSKPVIMDKIELNNYLYMLSGAKPEDFEKTEQDGEGNWIKPSNLVSL